jgi:hypothetical protein
MASQATLRTQNLPNIYLSDLLGRLGQHTTLSRGAFQEGNIREGKAHRQKKKKKGESRCRSPESKAFSLGFLIYKKRHHRDLFKHGEQGKPGKIVHACNPRINRLRQEDHEFKTRLGYIVRPLSKRGGVGGR